MQKSEDCFWFGDNVRQGVAVLVRNGYRVKELPLQPHVPEYVVPVLITGPCEFLLLAVWAKNHPVYGYVGGVIRGVELYRELIEAYPTVVVGDFNSNAQWDRKKAVARSHAGLVSLLDELGMASSYHTFHKEEHGAEAHPTLYFRWKEHDPFHIDYCFIPKEWAAAVRRVDVGSFRDWEGRSDHRPLTVDLSLPKQRSR